jgi:aspartyl-tRNA(Asn)/glutamyl-tRNA(Gln) amidotransferase subunit C
MQVDETLIQKLANLAKLRFSDNEKIAIQADLQRMIRFVQKMEEVNTGSIAPLLHMSATVCDSRADKVSGICNHEMALQNAQQHNQQFFLVPKVIKK